MEQERLLILELRARGGSYPQIRQLLGHRRHSGLGRFTLQILLQAPSRNRPPANRNGRRGSLTSTASTTAPSPIAFAHFTLNSNHPSAVAEKNPRPAGSRLNLWKPTQIQSSQNRLPLSPETKAASGRAFLLEPSLSTKSIPSSHFGLSTSIRSTQIFISSIQSIRRRSISTRKGHSTPFAMPWTPTRRFWSIAPPVPLSNWMPGSATSESSRRRRDCIWPLPSFSSSPPDKSCTAIINDALERFGYDAQYLVVKNLAKGKDFSIYDHSKLRERLLKEYDAKEIALPRLLERTVVLLDRNDLDFGSAQSSPLTTSADRSRVAGYLNRVYAQFETVKERV